MALLLLFIESTTSFLELVDWSFWRLFELLMVGDDMVDDDVDMGECSELDDDEDMSAFSNSRFDPSVFVVC